MRRYPLTKIRTTGPNGARYAVRWIVRPGAAPQRAIVSSLHTATDIRTAVRAGRDGWEALAESIGRAAVSAAVAEAYTPAFTPPPEGRRLIRVFKGKEADPEFRKQRSARGGATAAARMTPEQRSERARKSAAARWANTLVPAPIDAPAGATAAEEPPTPEPAAPAEGGTYE